MKRYFSAIAAQDEAYETGLFWGHCVFGGTYYVGTRDELARIGVVLHKQAVQPKVLDVRRKA